MTTKLDIAMLLDTTGSMGGCIAAAIQNMRDIVDDLVNSEKCILSLALIEFRDHPPQDSSFVTKIHDFTADVGKALAWLKECKAFGGGDCPEAVADAMYHCVHSLAWNADSKKFAFLITDALPHGVYKSDSFPNGCPDGHDPIEIAMQMAEKSISLFVIKTDCARMPKLYPALSLITGGRCFKMDLNDFTQMRKIIVGSILEDMSIDDALMQVHSDLSREVLLSNGQIDEMELTRRMQAAMLGGAASNKLDIKTFNDTAESDFDEINDNVEDYLRFRNMSEVREYIAAIQNRGQANEIPRPKPAPRKTKKPRTPKPEKVYKEGTRKSMRLAFNNEQEKQKYLNAVKSTDRTTSEADGIKGSESMSEKEDANESTPRNNLNAEANPEEPVRPEVRRIVRKAVARKKISLKR